MDQKLIDKLGKRQLEGTLRSLSCDKEGIDFHSNDYLGLAGLDITKSLDKYGSTGSRLISGTSEEALAAEKSIARLFKSDASLIYNSGYDANVGFFSSVLQRGDTILYDELIHASVRDGIRLSFANARSFKHNDLIHLEQQLERTEGVKYIAVESLYSMDGDFAPLGDMIVLSEKHNAYLIVDEAHAAGVFGEGLAMELNYESRLFARLVTFGKAYGSHGAAILGSIELIQYLYNFSRSFIYTTALPPSAYKRIEFIASHPSLAERRICLNQNIAHFRELMHGVELVSDEQSPIQIVHCGDILALTEVSERLYREGILVKAIFPPTVATGKERLRICLHTFNTRQEIEHLVQVIRNYIH